MSVQNNHTGARLHDDRLTAPDINNPHGRYSMSETAARYTRRSGFNFYYRGGEWQDRKGQTCRIIPRPNTVKGGSICVEFEDGFVGVCFRQAIRSKRLTGTKLPPKRSGNEV